MTRKVGKTDLLPDRHAVDLAHVRPRVFQSCPGNVKPEFRPVFIVAHGNSRIVADDVLPYCLNGLCIGLDPTDLKKVNKQTKITLPELPENLTVKHS